MSNQSDLAKSAAGFNGDPLSIDTANNRVGIGTSSPSAIATIKTASNEEDAILIEQSDGTDVGSLRINNGAFIIKGKNASQPVQLQTHDGNEDIEVDPDGFIKMETAGSERLRIDSSGNLLVGKTAIDSGVAGFEVDSDGKIAATRDGSQVAIFNRLTSDGDIVTFRKDGTTLGSIGVHSNAVTGINLRVTTSKSGLRGAASSIVPWYENSDRDNELDLGTSGIRWDDVYATNGTIQTSDENEKQQIAALTDAEMTAAKAISKLFKTFKWNDSVAEKGDAARTHTGVIAQEVEQAMTDAGLNAGDYAFFISTTWWETQTDVPAVEADEENGVGAQEAYTRTDTYDTAEEAPEGATERNRKGIRYPQLLSFIGAATEQRLASVEARLDALEGN